MSGHTDKDWTKYMFLNMCDGSHADHNWRVPRRDCRFESDNDPLRRQMIEEEGGRIDTWGKGTGANEFNAVKGI